MARDLSVLLPAVGARRAGALARALSAVAGRIDAFQDAVGRGVAWLSFLMVAVVAADVIMRYLFRISFVFVQELEWHLFAALYLLAAGYTLLHDDHVRVDIVYSRLSPRAKAWLDFILTLIFLFPACILMLHTAWPFVLSSWAAREGSPDPGGIPARYALKAVIVAAFALLALQGVSLAIKSFLIATGRAQPETRHKEVH